MDTFSTDQTDYPSLLRFIMHELRMINYSLTESARNISEACRGPKLDEERVRHNATVIVEKAAFLSAWLTHIDMHLDPEKFLKEAWTRRSLYDIFYRAMAILRDRTKKKGIKILLNGSGKFYVEAHPVIDILPFLILDNAVKYAPPDADVEVNLEETGNSCDIYVSSQGPKVEQDELASLIDEGYRGVHAKRISMLGYGLGLNIVESICQVHEASLKITSNGREYLLDDIPYCQFSVAIHLPTKRRNV